MVNFLSFEHIERFFRFASILFYNIILFSGTLSMSQLMDFCTACLVTFSVFFIFFWIHKMSGVLMSCFFCLYANKNLIGSSKELCRTYFFFKMVLFV